MTEPRALLLTDLVDSTALSERLGDARMAALWAAHDRIARDLLVAHRGREIDKTDGFLLLFEAATDAVAYALAYHRALTRLDPPVQARAGLHVGPVILTENAPADVARGAKPLEVDGLAKPTAARIMGLASGGQTLLSEQARAALGETPLRAESHGHWRMKGVSEPVELFEIGDDDAPFTPPPDGAKVYRVIRDGQHWLPVKQVKHSLLTERDAFVGRTADLQQLSGLLDGGAHLVSVLGIGGTGKTRLVTHYGWTWLGDWPGGVWFCDLSEARGVDGIVYAVARALDVPLGKDDPVVQLGHAIAGRGRCLVLLDNFEQVTRHADETLGRWLDRAHEAAFVVTSREVLGLPGEQALPLAPLVGDDASRLFVARARQAKPDFAPDDVASIDALVKLLDGLPLAIELAAARVRVMPPKALLARMSERFKLLTSSGGRRDRQATLRGTLDWSWDLLSADEQSALAQVSLFEGGFTLEAAEGVLALDELWPMDAVQALVDKSLVRQVTDERFDLLVSVQEYAAEKLGELGGRAEAEARHADWFAQLGSDEALDALDTHGGVARRQALAVELDNLVAACQRSVNRGAGEPAVALLRAAWAVLYLTGPAVKGLDLADRVAATPGLEPDARAAVATVQGHALMLLGRMNEARAHFDAALTIRRDPRQDRGRSRRNEGIVLGFLGVLHRHQGRMDEARAHFDAALEVARESWPDRGRDRRSEGNVLGNLGLLHHQQGRLDEARAHYDAALAVHREVGNRNTEGIVRGNLGGLHAQQGRLDEARAHFDAALAVHREVGDRRSEGIVLSDLGNLHAQQSLRDEARAHFGAALAVHREVGNRRFEGIVLGSLGNLHMDQGRRDEARAHFDAALAVAREVGDRRSEGMVRGNLGNLHREAGSGTAAREMLAEALALHREINFTFGQPYWLSGLALLDAAEGERDQARDRALEAVAVAAPFPAVQAEVLSALARVLLAAGDLPGARDALARGRALNPRGKPALLLAAADALVCEAEGDRDGCLAAIAEVDADPQGAQDFEVALLVRPLRERLRES